MLPKNNWKRITRPVIYFIQLNKSFDPLYIFRWKSLNKHNWGKTKPKEFLLHISFASHGQKKILLRPFRYTYIKQPFGHHSTYCATGITEKFKSIITVQFQLFCTCLDQNLFHFGKLVTYMKDGTSLKSVRQIRRIENPQCIMNLL